MLYTAPFYFQLYGFWLAADLQMKMLNACFAVATRKVEEAAPDLMPVAMPHVESTPV